MRRLLVLELLIAILLLLLADPAQVLQMWSVPADLGRVKVASGQAAGTMPMDLIWDEVVVVTVETDVPTTSSADTSIQCRRWEGQCSE